MTDFHAFERGGENFLFFPRTARLYQLSKTAAGLLPKLSGQRAAECPHDDRVLSEQLRDLLLQETSVPQPAPQVIEEVEGGNRYQTFSLYLSQSCNMACCYCWNQGGSFGKKMSVMDAGLAIMLARKIISLMESSRAGKVFVNFYGGEPLLNLPGIKCVISELRREEARLEKTIHFTLDTNGTLMEGDAAHFLAQNFSQIGVSLDGREEIHDLQRLGKHGECTWQGIADNILAFPNKNLLSLRATLTSFSDSYLESFRQLSRFGVRRIQLEYCHEPGYRFNPIYEKLVVPLERQMAELVEFIDYYVSYISGYKDTREIPAVSSLLDTIARIRRGNRFTRPCGAGVNTIAFDSHGRIFPCIAFVDRQEFVMGQIDKECVPLQQKLAGIEVDSQAPCHACWLRYDCAGGCYATHCGEPRPAYCDSMRSRAEVYYYALAQMMKQCPWHIE